MESILGATQWEELHSIVKNVSELPETNRLGSLWAYDFSLRIGANLGLFPEQVYCHRGVTEGASQLLERSVQEDQLLSISVFPLPVQALASFEIESFLCIGAHSTRNWFRAE